MLIIAGRITFDEANTDQAMEVTNKMAAASQTEDGCHDYVFAMESPGVIRLFECWGSDEALNAHMQAPHMAEFGGALGALGVTGMDLKRYEVSSVGPFPPS